MNIKRHVRSAVRALLAAKTPRDITDVVINNLHILPTTVISQVFDRLPAPAMGLLSPYIPRRLYRRIPVEYAHIAELRPLIYTRPARELWDMSRLRADTCPTYRRQYATWKTAKLAYRIAMRTGVCSTHCRNLLPYMSVPQINNILRKFAVNCNALTVTDLLQIGPVLSVADYRIVDAVLASDVLRATKAWYSGHAFSVVIHYAAVDRSLQRAVRYAASRLHVRDYVFMLFVHGLRRGKLYCRLSAPVKVYIALEIPKVVGRGALWLRTPKFLTAEELCKVKAADVCDRIAQNV